MFGKSDSRPITATRWVDIPIIEAEARPDDKDLPAVPAERTWFVESHQSRRSAYTGNEAMILDGWLQISRITGYTWAFSQHSGRWFADPIREVVSQTHAGGVYAWGLVE